FFSRLARTPRPTPFPYTTLFRSDAFERRACNMCHGRTSGEPGDGTAGIGLPIGRAQAGEGRNQHYSSGVGNAMGQCLNLGAIVRSEEHTSELQSRENLVCRLLLE